jgi:hypothetical protein
MPLKVATVLSARASTQPLLELTVHDSLRVWAASGADTAVSVPTLAYRCEVVLCTLDALTDAQVYVGRGFH